MNLSLGQLGIWAVLLLSIGLTSLVVLSLRDPNSIIRRTWGRYVEALDKEIRYLFLDTTGKDIAISQTACLVISVGAFVAVGDSRLFYLVIASVAGPKLYLFMARRKRIKRIEEQLDGWLMMLANMLRATGSLAEALESTADLIRAPLREELDLVVKELKVGKHLDEALLSMANRAQSPNLCTVVTMILVARSTGGELPQLLESTGNSLREMMRLEGVFRTQTAQGKFQLWILIAGPPALAWGLTKTDEAYFDPLIDNVVGWIVLFAAVSLWMLAVYAGKKILTVDY